MNSNYYSNQMAKMVSSDEFNKMLGSDASKHIIKYSDLEDKTDINDVIPESRGYRIILIETKQNTGHWTTLVKYSNNNFVWFDSYGLAPDQEFEFIPVKMQQILDEQSKPLSRLLQTLKTNNGTWNYNSIKFQQMKDGINTCGRWVTLFLFSFQQGYSLKDFQNEMVMEKKKTGLAYDELVVSFTQALN